MVNVRPSRLLGWIAVVFLGQYRGWASGSSEHAPINHRMSTMIRQVEEHRVRVHCIGLGGMTNSGTAIAATLGASRQSEFSVPTGRAWGISGTYFQRAPIHLGLAGSRKWFDKCERRAFVHQGCLFLWLVADRVE